MPTEQQRETIRFQTIYEVAIKVAFPLLMGISAWTFTALWDHESRLKTMESSAYTKAEATRDSKALTETLTGLRVDVARSAERNASVDKKMSEILQEIRDLRTRMDEHK